MFDDKYGLTQAVLEGRKTMTRRIVKHPEEVEICGHKYLQTEKLRYKVGEVVAVAQNLRDMGYDPRATPGGAIWGLDHTPAWTNKMFVSASQCKHQIRIINVRIERLQDISDEDCLREGVKLYTDKYGSWGCTFTQSIGVQLFTSPRNAFAALVDKVSGKGTWASNPWVYVYEFELVK